MGFFLSPLTVLDMQNLAAYSKRLNKMKKLGEYTHLNYTILTTTYNSKVPLGNIDFLRKYKSNVIICDDGSQKQEFLDYLNELEFEGFKVVRNKHKEFIKWDLLKKVVACPSREVALATGVEQVTTEYVAFLDDDSVPESSIGDAVDVLYENDWDIASTKVLASNREKFIEKLQSIEYEIAMLGREIRPYLTSGACVIAKTDSMKRIMHNHSMFYNGGDIEIGVIAKKMKMKVGHVDFKVYTEVPKTPKAWMKQRMYWASGNFRHCIINAWNYLKFDPIHIIYFAGLIWGFWLMKWLVMWQHPEAMPIALVAYIPITFIGNWKLRKKLFPMWKWMLIYPLYALFQILVLFPIGFFLYFKQVILYKNWGIIKLRVHKVRQIAHLELTPRLLSHRGNFITIY